MSRVYLYPLKPQPEPTAESALNFADYINLKNYEFDVKNVDFTASPIQVICLGAFEKRVSLSTPPLGVSEKMLVNNAACEGRHPRLISIEMLYLVISINNEIKSVPAFRCKTKVS